MLRTHAALQGLCVLCVCQQLACVRWAPYVERTPYKKKAHRFTMQAAYMQQQHQQQHHQQQQQQQGQRVF